MNNKLEEALQKLEEITKEFDDDYGLECVELIHEALSNLSSIKDIQVRNNKVYYKNEEVATLNENISFSLLGEFKDCVNDS